MSRDRRGMILKDTACVISATSCRDKRMSSISQVSDIAKEWSI
jgi:hypothetical protein